MGIYTRHFNQWVLEFQPMGTYIRHFKNPAQWQVLMRAHTQPLKYITLQFVLQM
jgi:hypothetical protein